MISTFGTIIRNPKNFDLSSRESITEERERRRVASNESIGAEVVEDFKGERLILVKIQAANAVATLCWFPGGGFVYGNQGSQQSRLSQLSHKTRFNVVMLRYPNAPEVPFEAILRYCTLALEFLHTSTDRLIVGGESAGASLIVLALLRLLHHPDISHERISGVILIAGIFDMLTDLEKELDKNSSDHHSFMAERIGLFLRHTFPQYEDRVKASFLPITLAGNLPPAVFICGRQDILWKQNEAMQRAWPGAVLEAIDEGKHGFMFEKQMGEDSKLGWQSVSRFLGDPVAFASDSRLSAHPSELRGFQ